jgi:pyrophosphatase PpaX
LKQEQIKIGVVTNNERRLAEKMLKYFTLLTLFNMIITKDDVENLKPYPEPLLKTLTQLGCMPEDCLYVGATEADIIAGKAASVKTVLIDSKLSRNQN